MKFQTSLSLLASWTKQPPWFTVNVFCLCYYWNFISIDLLPPEASLRAASLEQVTVLLNNTKCKSLSFPCSVSMVLELCPETFAKPLLIEEGKIFLVF